VGLLFFKGNADTFMRNIGPNRLKQVKKLKNSNGNLASLVNDFHSSHLQVTDRNNYLSSAVTFSFKHRNINGTLPAFQSTL